jgi:uncharacterized protein with von Willebrand factor type A (vWA) domain
MDKFFSKTNEANEETGDKNYQSLKKGLKETFTKYITSEFINLHHIKMTKIKKN